jgi:hypothetical protein
MSEVQHALSAHASPPRSSPASECSKAAAAGRRSKRGEKNGELSIFMIKSPCHN